MPTKLANTHQQNIDDITNAVMDDISDVLHKYNVNFPMWNSDNLQYNLKDKIYQTVFYEVTSHYQIKHGVEETELEHVAPFNY